MKDSPFSQKIFGHFIFGWGDRVKSYVTTQNLLKILRKCYLCWHGQVLPVYSPPLPPGWVASERPMQVQGQKYFQNLGSSYSKPCYRVRTPFLFFLHSL